MPPPGRVAYYRESNGVSGLQTTGSADTLVGNGALSSGTVNNGTWSLTSSTAALVPGTYTYYALATDAGASFQLSGNAVIEGAAGLCAEVGASGGQNLKLEFDNS